jgi:hypothetical protein
MTAKAKAKKAQWEIVSLATRGKQKQIPHSAPLRGCDFLSLLGKVVGTARKIRGFFASLRMTNKKVTASQDDRVFGFGKERKGNGNGKGKAKQKQKQIPAG